MNYNYFKNKRVLVTGHTGFKGSWLVTWLNILGSKVMGYLWIRLKEKTILKFKKNLKIIDVRGDIRNQEFLKQIKKFKPDLVFHLAAQDCV